MGGGLIDDNGRMSSLQMRLQSDLTSAMKARDETRTAALRMALAALSTEQTSGKVARELTDDEVVTVLSREVKKRREAAEAYDSAGRAETAARERAEEAMLAEYLPAALSQEELRALVDAAVAESAASGATGPRAMGVVMKSLQPQVKGRVDGSAVAAMVKAALTAE
jgi:uncharacterized protein YqeY